MKFETIKSNKKLLLFVVIIFVVILSLIISTSLAKYKVTESLKLVEGNINYSPSDLNIVAIYVKAKDATEYASVDTIPDDNYVINQEISYCKVGDTDINASFSYNANSKSLSISPITSKGTKCFLYFDENVTAANQIIALAGNGQVFNEGEAGYRYEGATVDNYVEFNDETWRILAVEEGSKIGLTSGAYYIKLIREDSIGNLAWTTGNNPTGWSTSTLYNILNNDYLNRSGDYTSIGISSKAKSQIESSNWHVNGADSSQYTASELYSYERADLNNYVNAYIGLMHLSDYGYASPTSICGNITIYDYINDCYSSNWIHKYEDELYKNEWVLMLSSTLTALGFVDQSGNIYPYTSTLNTRPSVYLKTDISFVEGTTGSSNNKFQIVE